MHPVTLRVRGELLDAGDAQRSRAWAGRHLHRTALGAVQVCSPDAHSPNLPLKHFAQRGFKFFLISSYPEKGITIKATLSLPPTSTRRDCRSPALQHTCPPTRSASGTMWWCKSRGVRGITQAVGQLTARTGKDISMNTMVSSIITNRRKSTPNQFIQANHGRTWKIACLGLHLL